MSHPEGCWNAQSITYTEEEIRATETLGNLNEENGQNRYAKVMRTDFFQVNY
jgi:hypothetical protein